MASSVDVKAFEILATSLEDLAAKDSGHTWAAVYSPEQPLYTDLPYFALANSLHCRILLDQRLPPFADRQLQVWLDGR